MASHFKLYDGMGEVVPFHARYQYPTQANRTWKSNIKIPPKNGGQPFKSGYQSAPIRIEFPAQGYLDARNSFLSFDVAFEVPAGASNIRIQNNVQSLFRRMRLMYGSLVIEDVPDYNIMVRMLTEGAGTNTQGLMDQTAINEGIAGYTYVTDIPADAQAAEAALTDADVFTETTLGDQSTFTSMPINGRLWNIQSGAPEYKSPNAIESDTDHKRYRRYQVQIALGFFQQGKLIPLKWMASQLTLEIELASFEQACACTMPNTSVGVALPAFLVDNITFNAQLLEFDGSYDAAFLEGLRGEGVPIKFASWDRFYHTPSASNQQTIMIPERNRSLKAIFAMMLPPAHAWVKPAGQTVQVGLPMDSHAFVNSASLFDQAPSRGPPNGGAAYHGYCKGYQFRIGGKYYPAQPVDCGQMTPNGGAEAYVEFAKALNIVGDYRLSTGITPQRWCKANGGGQSKDVISHLLDYPGCEVGKVPSAVSYYGDGPSCFVIAADLETSNGGEISGMNGEEQNDISLTVTYSDPQSTEAQMVIFVYYDVLMILRENNLVELIK